MPERQISMRLDGQFRVAAPQETLPEIQLGRPLCRVLG
jgi:hypothetical protein